MMPTAAATNPIEYNNLTADELNRRISAVKQDMGDKLLILAHHYQRDEIVRHADHRGDSLKLAQIAARERAAEFIVFGGVHFMAETADILTGAHQQVILPDLLAGCTMADMASLEDVENAWEILQERYEGHDNIVPVTYINSSADIKAFCGRHGGLTCTSANVGKVFRHVFAQNKSIMFLPDEHLGRNTGVQYGLSLDEILLWNPHTPEAALPGQLPRLIVWKGFCCVHQRFPLKHVTKVRQEYPGINVIVHPECPHSLVAAADYAGSTEYIIEMVHQAPAGSAWAIGTEANLVQRLVQQNPDKTVVSLNPAYSYCKSMNRLYSPGLLWALENLQRGDVVNRVQVDPETAAEALLALQRMLDLS